jgi:hypothetical protein
MSITVHTGPYKRQAARLMDIRRWPDAQKFWAGQAKGIMKEVIAHVPPAWGKADLNAKRIGEAIVASDVGKLFQAVAPGAVDRSVDLASIHSGARNQKGKVPRSKGKNKYKVSKAALTAYIKEEKSHVGYLAAGFNAAAAKVGYRPPAWIWRHSAPGSVMLRVSERGIHFRATNSVQYASKIGILQHQIQKGVNVQTSKLYRESMYLMLSAAEKAGFKTKSLSIHGLPRRRY